MSCFLLDSVLGQLTGHASVSGEHVAYGQAVVMHFAPTVFFFFFNEIVKLLSSFSLKFCHSFDQLVTGICVVQFCL